MVSSYSNLFENVISDTRATIESFIQNKRIPGLGISIITCDSIPWIEGFGKVKIEGKEVTENSLYCLQSTTKTITSVAYLFAVQEGFLSLDDSIMKHFPEFRTQSIEGDETDKITIRHLLSHKSGLPREAKVNSVFNYEITTWEKHIQSISGSWLKHTPGSTFDYSNAGMDLAAYILGKITKMPFPEYVQQSIGNALGIRIYYDINSILKMENAFRGYFGTSPSPPPTGLAHGCGGAFISFKDMAIFAQFLLNKGGINGEQILREDLIAMLSATEKISDYGLGTFITFDHNVRLYLHPGGAFGYGSYLIWVPDHNFAFIIGYNNEDEFGTIHELARSITLDILKSEGIDTTLKGFPDEDAAIIELSQSKLKRLTGEYWGISGKFIILVKEDALYWDFYGSQQKLEPVSNLIFKIKGGRGVIFELDKEGNPKLFRYYSSTYGIVECQYKKTKVIEISTKPTLELNLSGIYRYYVYNYYPNYFGVKQLQDSVIIYGGDYAMTGIELFTKEITTDKTIMVSRTGSVFEFVANGFYTTDNVFATKIDNISESLKSDYENDPKHHNLFQWSLDGLIPLLNTIGFSKEGQEIQKLKEEIYEN